MEELNEILKDKSIADVASKLLISVSTIKRWIQLNKIPREYQFDLLKLNNKHVNYSEFSFKQKEQYFTTPETVKYVTEKIIEQLTKLNIDINNYTLIEPSAGDGAFLDFFIASNRNYIAMDIEPRRNDIQQQDYLTWEPKDKLKKYIVIGNPPFGLRGNLSLRFIEHSFKFADFVCFILPQLFSSDGKGVPRKRINGNLIYTEKLNCNFLDPNGKQIKINTIFQVWSKNLINEKLKKQRNVNKNIKIFSVSDGGTPGTTRNKKMIDKCDVFLPATLFDKKKFKPYNSFNELPNKRGYGIVFLKNKDQNLSKFWGINWGDYVFLSTNSAVNIRSSIIYDLFE